MGQKLNSINFRLKKRLNWKTLMFVQDYNKYANLFYNNQETLGLIRIIMLKFGLYLNNNNIKKNSKQFCISSNLIGEIEILKQLIETNFSQSFNLETEKKIRKSILGEKIKNTNQLNIRLPWLNSNFSNLSRLKNNYDVKFNYDKNILIWPNLISQYIEHQLDKPAKNKIRFFNISLQIAILKFLSVLLTTEFIVWSELQQKMIRTRITNKNIIGLKLQLNGRWKKTKSGRSQTININFGKIKKTEISNKILFDAISFKTKYAACGLKIWISYKNANSSFLA